MQQYNYYRLDLCWLSTHLFEMCAQHNLCAVMFGHKNVASVCMLDGIEHISRFVIYKIAYFQSSVWFFILRS